MKVNKQVYWHQGLLLQPQHFQLESQFHQQKMSRTSQLLHNDMWGVLSLEIQSNALLDKRLVLSSGEILFQDGALCSIPDNAEVISRYFDDEWVKTGQSFKVYLGLKQWDSERSNVVEVDDSALSPTLDTRFIVNETPETVPDLYSSGVEGHTQPLKYLLKFFWEDEIEAAGDYMLMPVAILEQDGNEIRFHKSFIPPLVNAKLWPRLDHLLEEVSAKVVSRARQLERFKQPNTLGQQSAQGQYEILLAIRSLNRCAWLIQNVIETPVIHPRDVWSTLCEIVAEMSSFIVDISVADDELNQRWPHYDHTDLNLVFSVLIEQIERSLQGIMVGPEYVLPFTDQKGIWSLSLPDGSMKEEYRYCILFTGVSESQFNEQLSRMIRLSSTGSLSSLLAHAVSGIPLKLLEDRPMSLPQNEQGVYCEIDVSSPLWDAVREDKKLSMYWVSDADCQATLYVTRG